jgi:hypothetical protein
MKPTLSRPSGAQPVLVRAQASRIIRPSMMPKRSSTTVDVSSGVSSGDQPMAKITITENDPPRNQEDEQLELPLPEPK